MLREKLQQFLQKAQLETGYLPVITPHIGHKDLYITSGHYEKYGKDSFQPMKTPQEGEEFFKTDELSAPLRDLQSHTKKL